MALPVAFEVIVCHRLGFLSVRGVWIPFFFKRTEESFTLCCHSQKDFWIKTLKYSVCEIQLPQNWNGLKVQWAVLGDKWVEDSRSGVSADNRFPDTSIPRTLREETGYWTKWKKERRWRQEAEKGRREEVKEKPLIETGNEQKLCLFFPKLCIHWGEQLILEHKVPESPRAFCLEVSALGNWRFFPFPREVASFEF